ncbi:MAG TPA: helix-turn-helix transcriptional regulator [Pseudonocardiaceae bacterium]
MTLTVPTQSDARTPDRLRRRELAGFLRSRRERLAPDQLGLPNGGRRRTPGLRREEVAQLAGVGVTWYTWLEQGRDINASTEVLEAIARTLLLDRHERMHLFTLAGLTVDPSTNNDCYAVAPPVHSMLQQLLPFPAAVQNAKYDLLAYNATYGRLIVDLDALAPEDRNSMWLLFTHPAYRDALVDWEAGVTRMVATFRGAYGDHVGDPDWKRLVRRLRESSATFRALWDTHDVAVPERGFKRIVNSQVGLLRFEYTNLWLCQRRNIRMITYVPEDDETRARLEQLRGGVRGAQSDP